MKFDMRRLIVGALLLAATHQAAVTRYGGWEVEGGAQLIWNQSKAYLFAERAHHGRKQSAVRYVWQFVRHWPYSGIPADDQMSWVEVTEITSTATEKFVLRRNSARPAGVMDGRIYFPYRSGYLRWHEGEFVDVSNEELARLTQRDRNDRFSSMDGWSRAYVWGPRGETSHDLVLDGERLTITIVRSEERNSIIATRSDGSSQVLLDGDPGRVGLDAESYRKFVTDIPSK